ncbi:hypothetical protein C8F04DRAFT_1234152 [Mycena alexandri]|uniref:MYND-type domain-containing protein n=1 Tax=Mycena alexandri TaxID=1745969 RepID=A0AAD6SUW3_9AGAR|nr:hypothetical protein C8F04DRAFT_1234152 [Mycena alexandri]
MSPTSEPIHAPRTHLAGLDILPGPLPSLASVRTDAVEAKKMRERPENYGDTVLLYRNAPSVNANTLPRHLRLALIFSNNLPNLFPFSYLAQEDDVPEDVVDASIWALSLFIQIFEECPEAVLRAAGHLTPDIDYQEHRYLMLLYARKKMTLRLLSADRAQEAIPHGKSMVDEELTRGKEMWLQNPDPFRIYGEVLVRSRTDDKEAAKALRRALLGIESANWPSNFFPPLIRTRVFLSRALRNIGLDGEAKTHESWLATWFRKNPRLMPEREQTTKAEERIIKACRTCGARDPLATLSRCNSCKHIYYCSRACQKANWSHHKVECRERAEALKKIELMSRTDPDGAERAADWLSWCNSNHDAMQIGMIHALGLHREPQRGRTHIVFKQVEYVPTATKLKHKFRVLVCGVFRIKEVLRDLETVMRLDRGEGQEYVDSVFPEMHEMVPFAHLSFGNGVTAWLGSGVTSTAALRNFPYDPDWRKKFNVGVPPEPMVLMSGAKDVEHIF